MNHPSSRSTDARKKSLPMGLPLRGKPARRVILGAHLVFHGYGHWLSNDPRGSGSHELRKDELKELGDIHLGRKPVQPPRDELRRFYREAKTLLEHETIWFRDAHRDAIGAAFGRAAELRGYTLWACAVCSNHAHVVARTHRDRSEVIWTHLATAASNALIEKGLVPADHPVWSRRPYKVFLYSNEDVLDRIGYVLDNPEKEGLSRQHWPFVKPYPP